MLSLIKLYFFYLNFRIIDSIFFKSLLLIFYSLILYLIFIFNDKVIKNILIIY